MDITSEQETHSGHKPTHPHTHTTKSTEEIDANNNDASKKRRQRSGTRVIRGELFYSKVLIESLSLAYSLQRERERERERESRFTKQNYLDN
jgi:hypothetical protein